MSIISRSGVGKWVGILLLASVLSNVRAHNFMVTPLVMTLVNPASNAETTEKEVPPLRKKVTSPPNKSSKSAKKRPRRLDPFKKEQGKELLRASTKMGLGIFLIGGIGYMLGGTEALNAATFMSPLISAMLVKPLGDVGTKLCTLFTPYLANPGIRRAIDYKKRYERRKHKLTKSMRVFLDATIGKYTNWLNWDYESKECEKAIEEVLEFPLAPKPIDPDLLPITEFIKNYPEDVRINVGDFVVNTITDSKFEKLERKAVPLMFVGPPGTGKTYLATQIGNLLSLPVQIVDVTKYKSISGKHYWSGSSELGIIVDVLLGGKTKKGNFSNKILVLDEIDKALAKDEHGAFIHENGAAVMGLLHTLLETQETTARLARYEGAAYDISQLKIILISNRTFTEVLGKENAMALESRVNLVRFAGFQNPQKLAIARDYIKKVCAARSTPYSIIDEGVIEEIIKIDTEAGNEGVRIMLRVIDQYIRVLEKGALIGQVAGLPPITFDIKKAYSMAQAA